MKSYDYYQIIHSQPAFGWLLVIKTYLFGLGVFLAVTQITRGLTWSPSVILPKFERLNPITNLQNIFSKKKFFECLKSFCQMLIQLTLLIILMVFSIKQMSHMSLFFEWLQLKHNISTMLFSMLGLCLLFAGVDVLYARYSYTKKLKLTKYALKKEFMEHEGNPLIKNKRKQWLIKMLQNTAALSNIKNADVIITNPTHLAIALEYQSDVMPAPKVSCKGKGFLARHIKKIAQKHHIPIIEDKTLARTLMKTTPTNQYISPTLYHSIARLYHMIQHNKGAVHVH